MKTVINSKVIEEEIKEVLKQYGHPFTDKGVSKVVRKWLKVKAPLIEILENNPNWDAENLSIVVEKTCRRVMDSDTTCSVLRTLFNKYSDKLANRLRHIDRTVTERNGNGVSFDNGFYFNIFRGATEEEAKNVDEYYSLYKLSGYLRDALVSISLTEGTEITQGHVDELNKFAYIKGIAKVGQKKTRAFRAIFKELEFEEFDDYERLYARLADSLSEKEFYERYHISVHPLDYLLMSNGNSWRSCHMIDGGCYQSGTVSYLLDEATVVMYNTESCDNNETKFALLPKLSRNLFMISRNRNTVLQSRAYPNNDSQVRESNRSVFQEQWALSLGIQNNWVKFSVDDIHPYIYRQDGARNYPDYNQSSYRTLFRIKGKTLTNKDYPSFEEGMQVGACPMCFVCGGQDASYSDAEKLICDKCYDGDYDFEPDSDDDDWLFEE